MIKVKIDDYLDSKTRLKAKKNIAGDIVILDHPDIDILVSPEENRVLCVPKKEYADHIYALQSRLFDYLARKGGIKLGSVRGSNVFGSLQGTMLADKVSTTAVDPTQIAIFLIAKFLKDELHVGDIVDDYQDSYDKELTKPSDESSTELGKIPHDPRKGSNHFGSMNTGGTGFGMMQENKK
jgi:hypothetical protein